MTAPTIYNYDSATGAYLGSQPARQSPLDTPGTWLFPANSTLIEPPTPASGQVAIFSPSLGAWGLASKVPSPVSPPAGVASCQMWQLQAILTADQWTSVLAAVAALNNPAVTAFAMHGANFIPANSTTLIALGAAIGLSADQVAALVEQASAIVIP